MPIGILLWVLSSYLSFDKTGTTAQFVKFFGQKVVSGFCVNQRAETPFLRDGRGGNKSSGWRWACIELRKMANRASIGKVSQRG